MPELTLCPGSAPAALPAPGLRAGTADGGDHWNQQPGPGRHSTKRFAFPDPPVASQVKLWGFSPVPAASSAGAGGLCAALGRGGGRQPLGGKQPPRSWPVGSAPRPAGSHSANGGEATAETPGATLRQSSLACLLACLPLSLSLSLGGQPATASCSPATSREAGPISSGGRLPFPGTAAPDGSGAEAWEAALCQGTPDWLQGLCNG